MLIPNCSILHYQRHLTKIFRTYMIDWMRCERDQVASAITTRFVFGGKYILWSHSVLLNKFSGTNKSHLYVLVVMSPKELIIVVKLRVINWILLQILKSNMIPSPPYMSILPLLFSLPPFRSLPSHIIWSILL